MVDLSVAVRRGLNRNCWWKLIVWVYGARIDDLADWVSVWREIFESRLSRFPYTVWRGRLNFGV